MSKPELADVLSDYLKLHGWSRRFLLCPDTWKNYSPTHEWHGEKLDISKKDQIPNEPGIYTLILKPGIASHPACSYLMYVGKEESSLRTRFYDYLTSEKRVTGRPRIYVFLNLYEGFICFYYTPIKKKELVQVEDSLTNAYQPPLNTKVKGSMGQARRAF